MEKINKIIVKELYKTIPAKFDLEISDFTVITGENNSGKTNFIKTIFDKNVSFLNEKGEDITKSIEINYIPAEYIVGDDQFKIGKSSEIVKSLKDFITGDPVFELKVDNKNNAKNIKNIVDLVNKNIKEIFNDGSSKNESINISVSDEVPLKKIFDAVLEIIPFDNVSGMKHTKFEDLGQGWQRLIIAIFLLTTVEQNLNKDKLRLILFEEPEAYLHPKLKKDLNKMLKIISKNPNSQVIITTHDPYFSMTNLDDINNKFYSFFKNDKSYTDRVRGKILGIEDELVHMFLFNKVLGNTAINGDSTDLSLNGGFNKYLVSIGITTRKYFWPNDRNNQEEDMALPLYIRNILHHPENENTIIKKNQYSPEDLIGSIKELN